MNRKAILKKSMSVKYCGETRFDYLDEDEIPLILKAMSEYSSLTSKKLVEALEKCKYAIEKQLERVDMEFKYQSLLRITLESISEALNNYNKEV